MSGTQSLNPVDSSPNKRREDVRKEGLMAVICPEIPEELVYMFVERVVCVDDLIRFGAVSKLWRSVSISEKEKKKAYSPLMMLANAKNDNLPTSDGQGMRSFVIPYQVEDGDGNKLRSFNLQLPKAQGRRCWGSPYGWVAAVGLDLNISLLNPLSGEQLHLPPQPILESQSMLSKRCLSGVEPARIISKFSRKFALGWHPSSQSWLVMAIFGVDEEVAFAFAGIGKEPSSWTCIKHTADAEDVILFQGRIYLIAYGGTLKVFDINDATTPNAKAIIIAESPYYPNSSDTFYLVEIGGNLHFVARYYDPAEKEDDPVEEEHRRYVITDFIVWRFDFSNTMWYELDDLGEYALFLGNNTSYAISTITYPGFSRNCIYFTDDRYRTYSDSFYDMGVYDYKEKNVKPFDIADMGAFSKFSRPTFFMPTL